MNCLFKRVISTLIALLFCNFVFAAHEYATERLQGAGFTSTALYRTKDNKRALNTIVWPATVFEEASHTTLVKLGIDHFSNAYYALPYDITVNLTVTWETYSAGVFSGNSANTSLRVKYDPSTGTLSYKDIDTYKITGGGYDVLVTVTGIYDNINSVNLTNAPLNLYLETEIDAERYYKLNYNAAPYAVISDIQITGLTASNEIEVKWSAIQGAEEYELEWTWVSSDKTATNYEIDFKRNSTRIRTSDHWYKISQSFEKGYVLFRVRGVGRYDVNSNSKFEAEIFTPWSYPDYNNTLPTLTANSANFGYILSMEPAGYAVTNTSGMNSPHETLKNWQYSATYAEEGKKKEVISYFDGTLRNRQNVTKSNSDENAIVAETYYDYQGRGVIQTLPTPVEGSTIKFYEYNVGSKWGFNFAYGSSPLEPYGKEHFDEDGGAGTCPINAKGFSTSSSGYGTAYYYSSNNSDLANQQAYIPTSQASNGESYPFTQTEYTPDNTGRITRQSNVGPDLKLGTGHETKYFYGAPTAQVELDRLFGSEVGDYKHYKKNMVIDPNGQISVSYIDLSGKTIATGIAGAKPANLKAIDPSFAPTNVTADLLNKDQTTDPDMPNDNNILSQTGKELVFSTEMVVTDAGTYEFKYDMTGTALTYECAEGLCYDCIYTLEIDISDQCGNKPSLYPSGTFVPIKRVVGNIAPGQLNGDGNIVRYDTACNGPVTFTDLSVNPIKVTLNPGVYTVTKKLSIDEAALDYYLNQYINDEHCVATEQSFINAATGAVDLSGCDVSCAECVTNLGTESAFIANGGTSAEFQELVKACQEPCSYTDACQANYIALLADVSPGGQYAQWESSPSNCDPSGFQLSILNENNQLPLKGINDPVWKNTSITYKEDDGSTSYVTITKSGSTYLPNIKTSAIPATTYPAAPWVTPNTFQVLPQDLLNVCDFKNNWRKSWAKELVKFHPEYPYYEYCIKNSLNNDGFSMSVSMITPSYAGSIKSSHDYDSLLLVVDDLANVATGDKMKLVDPLGYYGGTVFDPYFIEGNAVWYNPYFTSTTANHGSPTILTQLNNDNTSYPNVLSALNRFNDFKGTGLSIYKVAYAMAQGCLTNYNTSLPPTDPCFSAMPTNPTSFDAKTWQSFKMLYQVLKQELQNEAAQTYALHATRPGTSSPGKEYNSCNDCIGNANFNPTNIFSVKFAMSTFATSVFANWYNNWFLAPVHAYIAPCGIFTQHLYHGKIKRFPSTDNVASLTNNFNANASYYQMTGKCPIALDLESTLNALVLNNKFTSPSTTNLKPFGEFTKLLYDAINGGAPSAYSPGLSWNPSIGTNNKDLTSLFKDVTTSVTKCTLNLSFPSATSATYNWTSTIVKLHSLVFTNYASGVSNFTIKATVQTGASSFIDVTLSGNICINLGACAFDPVCQPNGNANAFKDLFNLLAKWGTLCSSTSQNLTAWPYNLAFTNTFGQILPSGTWGWTYNSGTSTGLISAGGTEKITVNFSTGMNGTNELCSWMSSSNANNINIISFTPKSTAPGDFEMVYTYVSSSVSYTKTVTGNITITNSSNQTSAFSIGDCGLKDPNCMTKEHQVREDLEKFIINAETNNYFTSSSAVNITANTTLTSLLKGYISSNPNVDNITGAVAPIAYYWQNTSTTPSNVFGGSICSTTLGSAPTPGSNCCSVTFTINASLGFTQSHITWLGPIVVKNQPTTGGYSYNFYMLATYNSGGNTISDTLFGSTTCFPLRNCEPCSTTLNASTISSNCYTIESFESTLASAISASPVNHTTGTGCNSGSSPNVFSTFDTGSNHNIDPCEYGLAGSVVTSYNNTLNKYAGNKSYFIEVVPNTSTSFSITVYDKTISGISSSQKCYAFSGYYIKDYDMDVLLDLYVDNKFIGTQSAKWYTSPVWKLLNFGNATWKNTSGLTSVNIKIAARPITPWTSTTTGELNTVLGLDELKLCEVPCGIIPCVNQMPPDTMPMITYVNPCEQLLLDAAINDGKEDYYNYIDSIKTGFVEAYIKKCMGSVIENLTVNYNIGEQQFTLYYYDQAGNLVRTVPPQGVSIVGSTNLPTVKTDRKNYPASKSYFTAHDYKTTYTYNSLNQLIQQETPDAGISMFWYDKLGRLVASQNAQQFADLYKYSYTKYDGLGRIYEVGQVDLTGASAINFRTQSYSTLTGYLNPTTGVFPDNLSSASQRKQITRTYYGEDISANLLSKPTVFTLPNQYLRSRVAAVTISNQEDGVDTTFNHATFYNYDLHGNVKELAQINPEMAWAGGHEDKKLIQYDYDLISGKVNKVSYQAGQVDQFYHQYEYDGDNRITHVYTSKDNLLWDLDAKYFYYKHGPLARVELGDSKVQGFDYAYTLQGWIKGTNSEILSPVNDIGKDANTSSTATNYSKRHTWFAKDAASYNLNYFSRDLGSSTYVYDYTAASSTASWHTATTAFKANPFAISFGSTGPALWNGNISHMSTSYLNNDPAATYPGTGAAVAKLAPVMQLSGYNYDQLNRVIDVTVYKDINTTTNAWTTNTTKVFQEAFTYDKNGNILTAKRNDNTNASNTGYPIMDNITYGYTTGDNKLDQAIDAISGSTPNNDIEPMSNNNYTYDLNGNLIGDAVENISNIDWTVYGKIHKITYGTSPNKVLGFKYDANGNRVSKRDHLIGNPTTQDKVTFYVRDAQGNVMATYDQYYSGTQKLELSEIDLYGSSRLGYIKNNITVPGTPAASPSRTIGLKNFELTNHLGNVLSVVNDSKAPVGVNNTACVNVMDMSGGPPSNMYYQNLTLSGTGDDVTGTLSGNYSISGADTRFGYNLSNITYLIEFDWDPGTIDINDAVYIIPFDLDFNTWNFYMGSYLCDGSYVMPKGHYSFTYTPSYTGTNTATYLAINSNANPSTHYWKIDNLSLCALNTPAYVTAYNNPKIVYHSDYYAFGANKPGTQWSAFLSGDYRYGMNGKEKDDEISGSGNNYDFGDRIYEARLGRLLSVDPFSHKAPFASPYSFADNNPIWKMDNNGDSTVYYTESGQFLFLSNDGLSNSVVIVKKADQIKWDIWKKQGDKSGLSHRDSWNQELRKFGLTYNTGSIKKFYNQFKNTRFVNPAGEKTKWTAEHGAHLFNKGGQMNIGDEVIAGDPENTPWRQMKGDLNDADGAIHTHPGEGGQSYYYPNGGTVDVGPSPEDRTFQQQKDPTNIHIVVSKSAIFFYGGNLKKDIVIPFNTINPAGKGGSEAPAGGGTGGSNGNGSGGSSSGKSKPMF